MTENTFQESIFWMSPPPATGGSHEHSLPESVEVAVIGSGYTGMVAALQLKKAGVEICVLEQNDLGSGASSRNGGMVLTGLSVSLQRVFDKFGKERLVRYFSESLLSIDRVEQLVRKGGIDCDFKRCGHLEAAFKPSHFHGLCREQEFLDRHLDHRTEIIPRERLEAEIDSRFYHGALLDPLSARIQPACYINGLIRMTEKNRIPLFGNTPVISIKKQKGCYLLNTGRGVMRAKNLLVATNGYTSGITPWHRRRVVPVESFMIATECMDEQAIAALIPQNRMIFDTKRFLYYFRLSPDKKRILFGGRPRNPGKPVLEKAESLRREMVRVFPQLKPVKIEYAWSGNVGFTVNYFPLIGHRDNIYYSLGYCGHGIAMASYLGFELAGLITKGSSDTVFMENQPGSIPFYRGNPWFLPLVHNWFRFLDLLGK